MRRRIGMAVCACALLALAAQASARAPGPQSARGGLPVTAVDAAALGKQAYDYGFPLLEFARVRREMTSVRCPDHKGNAPANAFSTAKQFADATARTVVAPNTDTLYSIAHLNLKKGPVTLSHPAMGQRYYSFEMLDPYTNVIDIPGTREDGGDAGKFLVRWTNKPGSGRKPHGARVINTRYQRVWVIGRTLATGRKDQARAYKLMRRYKLTRANGTERHFPEGCKPGTPKKFPTPTDGAPFLRALNKRLAENPPPKRDEPLLDDLAQVGVGPGLSPENAGLAPDALAALYAGVAGEAASLPTQSKIKALVGAQANDGWYLPPSNIGDYGTDYQFRAMIASVGLGANTPQEAIYPAGITDSQGVLYTGLNDYRLTFPPGDAPPAKYFWSLTMYDFDGYLVPNSADRYSVGPSHPPLVKKPDGSIVIAIQQAEPTEDDVNWLPSPAGAFRLNLRLYGPRKAALEGSWKPPGVERVLP